MERERDRRDREAVRSSRDRGERADDSGIADQRKRHSRREDGDRDSSRRSRRRRSHSPRSSSSPSSSPSSSSPSPSRSRRHHRGRSHRHSNKRHKREQSSSAAHALPSAITSDAALHYGYSNESNPFNDASLSSVFVWRKKLEADLGKRGEAAAAAAVTEEQLKARQRRLVEQIEEVKRRRLEREEEKAALAVVKEQQERERLAEHVAGWEKKEEDFHKQQAKMKTRIRMREKREKAIDLLLQNVAFEQWSREDEEQRRQQQQHGAMMAAAGAGAATAATVGRSQPPSRARKSGSSVTDLQVTDPVSLLSALSLPDLLETRAEVDKFIELKEEEAYWKAVRQLCDDEIRICRREKRERGVSSAVLKQIDDMLAGRSRADLERLELQVDASMQEVGADVAYWTAVLAELRLSKAVAFLRELHADLLRRRLVQLKAEKEKRRREEEEARRAGKGSEETLRSSGRAQRRDGRPSAAASEEAELRVAVPGALPDVDDGNADHHLSPRLFSLDEELDIDVVSAADDERQLQTQRFAALAKFQPDAALLDPASAATPFSSSSSAPSAAAHEYSISNELALPVSAYSWRSAHRPRKPRYFNRVKTGFDWNRYNQTHYDKDSPPPKIVQGYKFNLFYPDLIDPSVTPRYRLEPLPAASRERDEADAGGEGEEAGSSGSSSEYCMLRFIGGAPYEDVAFKIVRREWEFAPRRGFRCVFDKGVMQLHFNFKRFFYRR